MAAVQEYRVNLATETDVTIVKRFLFLFQQVSQFIDLLLKHNYLLSQEGIVLPLDLRLAAAVYG